MEWISVKDRLPKEFEKVIVWSPWQDKVVADVEFGYGCFFTGEYESVSDVTHWIYEPEPPDNL
jgi:hypothetical protein